MSRMVPWWPQGEWAGGDIAARRGSGRERVWMVGVCSRKSEWPGVSVLTWI